MQTLLGAQLLSDLTLARIRSFNKTWCPQPLGALAIQTSDNSVLRGARPWIDVTTALVTSRIIYQGRFALSLAVGFNNNATIRYIQFFDQSTLPSAGNVPIQSIPVNAQQEWSWSPSQDGLIFEHACVIGISTTAATFTAGAADLFTRVEGLVL